MVAQTNILMCPVADYVYTNRSVHRIMSACVHVSVCLTGDTDCLLADIAATSVEQCETRFKEMLERTRRERGPQRIFQAEFITADCSKVRSVKSTITLTLLLLLEMC